MVWNLPLSQLFLQIKLNESIFFVCFSESDPEIERILLQILSDSALLLPINSIQLIEKISLLRFKPVTIKTLSYFLQKLATQSYIR